MIKHPSRTFGLKARGAMLVAVDWRVYSALEARAIRRNGGEIA